jgi:sugar phosphate permease
MSRFLTMFTLVLAGELVFGLPFHIARFFRPTLLEVFGFSNTQLGDIFAVYGVTAMLSYFPGGLLADRFTARSLIAAALIATSVGGLYMATFPGATGMGFLYGYWGLTTIFLVWGALIRATREWGGPNEQGLAFGVLEGGRGLAAAAVSTVAVFLFASYLPEDADFVTAAARDDGFRSVVLLYSLFTFLVGLLAWFAIPVVRPMGATSYHPVDLMGLVARRPVIWAQAAVIICAYCGYRGLDNYSLYANDVLGMSKEHSSKLMAAAAWIRPVAALLAGLIADRFSARRSIAVIFAVLLVIYSILAVAVPDRSGNNVVLLNFAVSFVAVFALRGVYFALLEESLTPKFLTGSAVGMVSVIGFTPEIFFGPITGRILDASPGLTGHQDYFRFLAVVAALGVLVVFWLMRLRRRAGDTLWPVALVDAEAPEQK